MRLPTFSHTGAARLFILLLLLAASCFAWADTSPERVSLIPCLFYRITGTPCPGCGMTRSCVALVQGDFTAAWHYHPLSFVLIAFAFAVAFFPARLRNAWLCLSSWTRNFIVSGGILLCICIWLCRLHGVR